MRTAPRWWYRIAMKRLGLIAVLMTAVVAFSVSEASSAESGRFFFSGDGRLRVTSLKNGKSFEGIYRVGAGRYDPDAVESLCEVFDAPHDPAFPLLSLRLVEYMDFLEDRLLPGTLIRINSGYRPPAYNDRLRGKGALAAKASLHQYGMAVDLRMDGVSARRLWETVKELNFGGAGYYHGESVHIDVGPARSWDETTSGVGTGISDDNKLIGMVTDYDLYRPGDRVVLRFIRMTAFPIGVSAVFSLDRVGSSGESTPASAFRPAFATDADSACPQFSNIEQMARIRWRLPDDLPAGRYAIRADFCDSRWEKMPTSVATPAFELISP
ncbi:MAG: YcbK family protein [Desulfobacterales bacterium]